MGKVKQKASKDSSSMMRPALTPEARENQLISSVSYTHLHILLSNHVLTRHAVHLLYWSRYGGNEVENG